MTDRAQTTTQALFLADEKIAEVVALGYPDIGTRSGTVQKDALCLHWRTEVTKMCLPRLEIADITGLREVSVDVNWKQGAGRKHLRISTCIADRNWQ